MAYNSNDNPAGGPLDAERSGSTTTAERAETRDPVASAGGAPVSAAHARFNSCRWQQPKEEGSPAFCTHREVKPYAGTTEFDPEAWCPECQYYKLRRAPKKRSPADDYTY